MSLILRHNTDDRYISTNAAEEQHMVLNNNYGETFMSQNVAYDGMQIDGDGDTSNYEVVDSVEGNTEGMAAQEIVKSSESLVPGYSQLQQNIISTTPQPVSPGEEVQYDEPSIDRDKDGYSHLEY